jgi:hypothetical protein
VRCAQFLPRDKYPPNFVWDADSEPPNFPLDGFSLVGFLALMDPPRETVRLSSWFAPKLLLRAT